MSIFSTILRFGNRFEITKYTRNQGPGSLEFQIKANVTVPIDLFSDELWYKLDNDFEDRVTGTRYYTHSQDGDDEYRWAVMEINLKNSDILLGIEIVKTDLQELIDLI